MEYRYLLKASEDREFMQLAGAPNNSDSGGDVCIDRLLAYFDVEQLEGATLGLSDRPVADAYELKLFHCHLWNYFFVCDATGRRRWSEAAFNGFLGVLELASPDGRPLWLWLELP